MRASLIPAVILLSLCTAPAGARVIDYSAEPDPAMIADLEVDPASPLPDAAAFDIGVDDLAAADHEVYVLTLGCRGYDVENPASQIIARALSALDRDGDLAATDGAVRLMLRDVSSTLRCTLKSDVEMRCIGRATLRAALMTDDAGEEGRPVYAQVERSFDSDGFCAGIAQGMGYVTREAAVALAENVRAALAPSAATARD